MQLTRQSLLMINRAEFTKKSSADSLAQLLFKQETA